MTQRNIVALEARGAYVLFVCLLLSALLFFVSPHFCRAIFLLLTLSLFCRVELTLYSLFLARKKMMIIIVEVVVVVGFNCV